MCYTESKDGIGRGTQMKFDNLSTERIDLSTITPDDMVYILEHFSNADVNTFLYDAEPLANLEEAKEIIDFYVNHEPRLQVRWIMTEKVSGKKIGTCGFHRWNKETGVIEMGYDLDKAFWGFGFMTEAMAAILDYAQNVMKVKRVEAHIFVGNAASIRLVEKFGFERSGEYNEVFRGEEYPHWIFSKSL